MKFSPLCDSSVCVEDPESTACLYDNIVFGAYAVLLETYRRNSKLGLINFTANKAWVYCLIQT